MKSVITSIIIHDLWIIEPRPVVDAKAPAERIFDPPFPSAALVKKEKKDNCDGAISRHLLNQLLGTLDSQHSTLVEISWSFAVQLDKVNDSRLQVEANPEYDLILTSAPLIPTPVPEFRPPRIVEPISNIQLEKLDDRAYLDSVAKENNVKIISETSAQDLASMLRAIHHYKERVSSQSLNREGSIGSSVSSPSSRAYTPSSDVFSSSDAYSRPGSVQDLRSTMDMSRGRTVSFTQRQSPVWSSPSGTWQIVRASTSPSPLGIKQEDDI